MGRALNQYCYMATALHLFEGQCGVMFRYRKSSGVKPMSARKNRPYLPGELEVILSLAPSGKNISFLSELLGRSENAIELVYKIAFEHGPFGKQAGIQEEKILAAKKRVGISIGRKVARARHAN